MCLPALGEKGSEHDGTRDTQTLVTEVSFGHGSLDGDDKLAPASIAADGEFLRRPDGGYGRCSMGGAGVSGICTDVQTAQQRTAWPCGDATYLHSGRAAAMCLAPSDPRSSLTSKLVNALMVVRTVQVLERSISRWRADLLAHGQEGGHNNRTRFTQLLAAEVGFGHVRLHGDGLAVAKGDGL